MQLLRAEHAVAEVLLDCATSEEAFRRSLEAIGEELGWQHAGLWIASPAGDLQCAADWQPPGVDGALFALRSRGLALAVGEGLPGRVWSSGEPAWITDIAADSNFPRAPEAAAAGLKSAVAFPLEGASGVVAVTEVLSDQTEPPDDDLRSTLVSIGRKVGQFVEHKRAERATLRSEARKRAILDAALDCVITMDHEGRVVEANAALDRIFGWPPEEAEGREMAELIVPPELREPHRAGLLRVVGGGEPRQLGRRIELTGLCRDGRRIPVELTITQIDVPGPPMFTGHVRDITDRKAAEQELRASRVRLVSAGDRERRRIERNLHDGAQQRLVSIALSLRTVEDRAADQPEVSAELLREARAELEAATIELRELARGIHPTVLTERGLEAALAGLVRRSPLPVETEMRVPERLPVGVESAAYFVMAEAFANAVRHSGAGRLRLSAAVEDGTLRVSLTDDGAGGADPRGGGLSGLADRLTALDGRLDVTSEPGTGTTIAGVIPCG